MLRTEILEDMEKADGQDQPKIGGILQAAKSGFVAVGAFSLFINLLMLVQPFYMLQVFDRVLRSRSTETLLFLSLLVLGLFILMGILQIIRSRILVRVGVGMDERLGGRLFDAMFRRSLCQRSGGNPQAIDDLSNVRQFSTGPGILALFDAPWMPVYLGVMFLFNTWLGIYGVACTLIIGAPTVILVSRWLGVGFLESAPWGLSEGFNGLLNRAQAGGAAQAAATV